MRNRRDLIETFRIWVKEPIFLSEEALSAQCADEAIKFAKEYHSQQLILNSVSQQRELLIAFFMHFRDNGEQNIGMTIEQFVDDFLSN